MALLCIRKPSEALKDQPTHLVAENAIVVYCIACSMHSEGQI